ncbi:right-handed parallel beta-helix repeat-containing protein [Sphingomonas sp.]|uniref:right-handed parallel beta-helix repeat-containing protein n=1 Tax=Sphingomonas sp. TaxID=28214 RepID=UPI001B0AD60E|nr:right-handed parallel beta-helix repeat-containing protein [Sphingomonas sp.]MBO9714639.1 right-handed parallel beta-helix repeat-containing protein [Sphingomonas sp.]
MRRALLLALALAAPASAQRAAAPFSVAETGRGYGSLQDAVQAIGGGRGTILIAPGTYRECAVQTDGMVTYKAVQPGTAVFERETCEDKAALVLRGRASIVDGLVFRGYSVNDGNGAGIRIETGDLSVANAMFLDSQQGILGGNPSAQRITIDHSTFAGLGQCDESVNCSHAVYLINRGQVTITRSRFERGTGGHYVKLRVPSFTITGNSFDDSAGRGTNYMIDLSEGGTGTIAGNVFVQGAHKENASTLIAVAPEARTYPSNGLAIEYNTATLAPGAPQGPAFVTDFSHAALRLGANQLGPGIQPLVQR